MKLYHVTTIDRSEQITENGIDPKFAQGLQKASWFVEESHIEWAIIHTSKRHKCPTDFLCIFTLDMNIGIGELSTMGFRRWKAGRWMRFLVTNDCEVITVDEYMLRKDFK